MAHSQKIDIYGGVSPLEYPAYSIADVAHYLRLPRATIRSWTFGRTYPTRSGQKAFEPVIPPAEPLRGWLSFQNLIEIHVLSAVRRRHHIRLDKVRSAIRFLAKEFGTKHPLANEQMFTDNKNLFVEKYGSLVSASAEGQIVLKDVLAAYLERVERSPQGVPIRLFPFARERADAHDPKFVVIDPRVQFGRPCIAGKNVTTAVIVDRYKAGESSDDLAEDYRCSRAEIEEAVRYEFPKSAA